MNAGIIVYSHTGNTYSVAEQLKKRLERDGYAAELKRVEASGYNPPDARDTRLTANPDIGKFDRICFCSPVEAFSLSPVMKRYLKSLKDLNGKKVSFLVTQHFRHPFLGGNRAVNTMKKICEKTGAAVAGSAIVNWTREDREAQITRCVELLSADIASGDEEG